MEPAIIAKLSIEPLAPDVAIKTAAGFLLEKIIKGGSPKRDVKHPIRPIGLKAPGRSKARRVAIGWRRSGLSSSR